MPGDPMFFGNEAHYGSVGASALKAIVAAHLLANKADPQSVLDFACGAGRVTRWLRAAFPVAELDVSDIYPELTTWTSAAFGANGWRSSEDLSSLVAPRQYDLIWSGSLATHLSANGAKALMNKFHEWLAPQGIAVMTTHGSRFLELLLAKKVPYFHDEVREEKVAALMWDLVLKGYGFAAHGSAPYGISGATLEWHIAAAREFGARVLTVSDHTWDNHQDVIAFQKAR